MRGLSEGAAKNVRDAILEGSSDPNQTPLQKAIDAALASYRVSQNKLEQTPFTLFSTIEQNKNDMAAAKTNYQDLVAFVTSQSSGLELGKFADLLSLAGDLDTATKIREEIQKRKERDKSAEAQKIKESEAKAAADAKEQERKDTEAKIKEEQKHLMNVPLRLASSRE